MNIAFIIPFTFAASMAILWIGKVRPFLPGAFSQSRYLKMITYVFQINLKFGGSSRPPKFARYFLRPLCVRKVCFIENFTIA